MLNSGSGELGREKLPRALSHGARPGNVSIRSPIGRRCDFARMDFVKLVEKLIHFHRGLAQGPSASGRDAVNPAPAAADTLGGRLQQSAAFQSVQERVKSSGADAIAVMGKLFDHGQPKDGFVRRMHEHVHPNEAREKLALFL